jgi:NAD(P)-dependent dehydrogenase (short-subunit alcohol dehydrogenase family)
MTRGRRSDRGGAVWNTTKHDKEQVMSIRFDGRVAIITGAGAGIGRAHAILLASRGAQIVVNDLPAPDRREGTDTAADLVVADIKAAGGEAVASYSSVAEPGTAAEIIATAIGAFGKIDIVVNNAGILRDKSFLKMDLADFELVLKVHLLGSAYVTKAAWPYLVAQKYGRIVLTSSASGLAGSFGQANYGAAKAGMIGLMNNLKNEGAPSNILVNTVTPVAATQMTAGLLSDRMTVIAKAEHISPAVAWLCSEACDVTGQNISAGGGHYASIHMVKTRGVVLDPDKPASIEDFASARNDIFALEGAAPYGGTFDPATKEKLGL